MKNPLTKKLGPEAARLFLRTCARILENPPAKPHFKGLETILIFEFHKKWYEKTYFAKKPLTITFTIAELHAFYYTLIDYRIPSEGTEDERRVTQEMISWAHCQIVNQTYKQALINGLNQNFLAR